jgi:hypothetical protein
MQVRSGVMGKMECIIVIELQGYLALHVSFAHITPYWIKQAQME